MRLIGTIKVWHENDLLRTLQTTQIRIQNTISESISNVMSVSEALDCGFTQQESDNDMGFIVQSELTAT